MHRTVLEVGLGQGRIAAVLLDAGHCVIGVDPSATMVKQATARNRVARDDARADLRSSDGTTIPFSDDTADVASSAHAVYSCLTRRRRSPTSRRSYAPTAPSSSPAANGGCR